MFEYHMIMSSLQSLKIILERHWPEVKVSIWGYFQNPEVRPKVANIYKISLIVFRFHIPDRGIDRSLIFYENGRPFIYDKEVRWVRDWKSAISKFVESVSLCSRIFWNEDSDALQKDLQEFINR